MTIQVEQWPVVDRHQWDALVADSDDVWLYHQHRWIEGVSRVHSVETHYFVAVSQGRWIGAFPVQARAFSRKHGRSHQLSSILMGACGPFVHNGLSAKERAQVFQALQQAVLEFASTHHTESLKACLPPLAPGNLQAIRGINPLALAGWRDTSSHTLIADLSKPEDALWSGLAYDARRSVKLARQAGYTVKRVRWAEVLTDYYRIHTENYERTGVKPHPTAYFELIAEMDSQDQCALWMASDCNNQPVAFHNCGRFKDAALYWTGCSETAHLKSGVNYLLFWEALIGAKRDGCQWYEIGEIFPEASNEKQKGLSTFKKKFGGELFRFFKGEWPLSPILVRKTPWASLKQRFQRMMTSSC